MKEKLVILDFDGVLVDSFSPLYSLISQAMAQIGVTFSEKQYRCLFDGNIHAGFRSVIRNDWDYRNFLEFRRANFQSYYDSVRFFPGAVEFIKKAGEVFKLSIASSGSQSAILKLLTESSAESCFAAVEVTNELSKELMLKKIVSALAADRKQTFLVTDTLGDLLLAKALALRPIAVSWGFHPKEKLQSAGPERTVDFFDELYTCLLES